MVFGQTVEVDFNKTDRYGRLNGKIVLQGQDANLQQLQAGMAWHYKEYEREQPPEERRRYAQAEDDARAQRVGLWTDPKPVPP
ncbi:thermonuclease family protein [Aquabacterium sp. A08]|uniref:thermonuclease family protein n=1 Tax=Aquabacterium sp. A08 TaxID=2718532 RepID=UPI001FBAA808